MRRRILTAKNWLFEPYGACSLLVLTWMHQLVTLLIVLHEKQWEDTLFQGSPELFSPTVKRRALGSRLRLSLYEGIRPDVIDLESILMRGENRSTRRKTLGVGLRSTETQLTYDLEARVEPGSQRWEVRFITTKPPDSLNKERTKKLLYFCKMWSEISNLTRRRLERSSNAEAR